MPVAVVVARITHIQTPGCPVVNHRAAIRLRQKAALTPSPRRSTPGRGFRTRSVKEKMAAEIAIRERIATADMFDQDAIANMDRPRPGAIRASHAMWSCAVGDQGARETGWLGRVIPRIWHLRRDDETPNEWASSWVVYRAGGRTLVSQKRTVMRCVCDQLRREGPRLSAPDQVGGVRRGRCSVTSRDTSATLFAANLVVY